MIGDMLCVLPVFYSIRKKYPKAHITVLTSTGDLSGIGLSRFSSVLPWIDSIDDYSDEGLNSFSGAFSILQRLRRAQFDMWLSMPQSSTIIARELRDMLFARMAGVKWAFGFSIRTTSIFKHEQGLSRNFKSEVEFLQELVQKEGVGIEHDEGSCLQMPDNLSLNLQTKLQKMLRGSMPILVIAPGAKRPTNRWAVERFAEVASRWSNKLGHVVIVGGANDEAIGEQITNVNCNQILNLCGKTDVIETMCLLKKCTVALTNDSGPMHMAVAVNLPVVVAFSARDFPGLWHPTSSLSTVIRKKVDCSPCLAETCSNGNLCLEEISVEEVWEKIEKYFFYNIRPS
jgi:ADP-heptose:LPS heptosyltransferase